MTHLLKHAWCFQRQGGIETRGNVAEAEARRFRPPTVVFPAKLGEKHRVANERLMLAENGKVHEHKHCAARIIQVLAALSLSFTIHEHRPSPLKFKLAYTHNLTHTLSHTRIAAGM